MEGERKEKVLSKYLRAIGYTIGTIALYLGVSLLGWGLTDLPDYFAEGSKMAYAFVVLGFGIAIGYQAIDAPEGVRGSSGEKAFVVRRQRILNGILILLLYAALFFYPFAEQHSIGLMQIDNGWAWFGVILCAAGYALVYWSGFALGKMYSKQVTIQQNHQLITENIYRYIRHPRYLGVILVALGLALIYRSWIGLVVIIPLVAILILRITDEEAIMRQQFGESWDNYCKHSWRLIPYVY